MPMTASSRSRLGRLVASFYRCDAAVLNMHRVVRSLEHFGVMRREDERNMFSLLHAAHQLDDF